jgi:hypothetical protein
LARNRYGWQKRAKEMARKEKNDEKMKRRQGKFATSLAEEMPGVIEEKTIGLSEPTLPETYPIFPVLPDPAVCPEHQPAGYLCKTNPKKSEGNPIF